MEYESRVFQRHSRFDSETRERLNKRKVVIVLSPRKWGSGEQKNILRYTVFWGLVEGAWIAKRLLIP